MHQGGASLDEEDSDGRALLSWTHWYHSQRHADETQMGVVSQWQEGGGGREGRGHAGARRLVMWVKLLNPMSLFWSVHLVPQAERIAWNRFSLHLRKLGAGKRARGMDC